jgi:hypothetical protein
MKTMRSFALWAVLLCLSAGGCPVIPPPDLMSDMKIEVVACVKESCDASKEGKTCVRMAAGMPRLEFCDGTKWTPLAPPAPSYPDCPIGYERDPKESAIVLCRMGRDEVVRVGNGASAFWIDRYEGVLSRERDGRDGALLGDNGEVPSLPRNGQATGPVYGLSIKGRLPRHDITWFQANEACRASGKRLPTGDEWQAAARGTPDPGKSDGSDGTCVTAGNTPRRTGNGAKCMSDWGAEEMIGNLSEWTAEWYAGLGTANENYQPWPAATADYGKDGTYNIISRADHGGGGLPTAGLPAAMLRGGAWGYGDRAGIFAVILHRAPSHYSAEDGFRCVIPR